MEAINNGHFYNLRNKILWETAAGMAADQLDIISLRQTLKDSGQFDKIGGDSYLSECQDSVPSTANLPAWLELLVEKRISRDIIAACARAIADAYEASGDTGAVLDRIEALILSIRPNQKQCSEIKELVRQAIGKIETRFLNGANITGISTGLHDLDRMSDGVHPGEMVVVAAFPGTGKTALAVNIAVRAAFEGLPTAIFSAEMQPVQLVVRSICSESRVNFHRVRQDDFPKMMEAVTRLSSAPLYIEQANQLSIAQICAMGRRLKQKHGIKLAVIDYIQLLRGTGDNREQEISSISKGVKAMAMELDIPILALSQLNDDGKLRESRAIGQDADTIWKLENNGAVQPLVQPIKLAIIKCRHGATGGIDLTFMKEYTRFENMRKIDEND